MSIIMDIHKGKITEEIVRNSGIRLKILAKKLNITKNTLCKRFAEKNLNLTFVRRIGDVLSYDFSKHFPELLLSEEEKNKLKNAALSVSAVKVIDYSKKYRELRERYNSLIGILVQVANENESKNIQKEIGLFIVDEDDNVVASKGS